MNQSINPTEIKEEKQPRKLLSAIIALVAITGLSVLTAFGLGGITAISLSTVAFAYLLLSQRNIIPWISVPLSFAVAYLITAEPLSAAAVLLFVPAGIALAHMVYTRKNLSLTVTVLCVVLLIATGAYLTLAVTQIYEDGIKESYLALGSDIENAAKEAFSAFRYEGASKDEVFALSDEDISALLNTAKMLLPSVVIITCELMAYGAAKLLYLFLNLFGFGFFYGKKPYAVTLSAAAGATFILAYAVSFLSGSASVAAYSALNITYILMPLSAIAGFHFLFSKNGVFRNPNNKTMRLPIIISTAICAVLAPFSFVPLLAMFGSAGAVISAIGEYMRSKARKHDD